VGRETVDEPPYIVELKIKIMEGLDFITTTIILTAIGGDPERFPKRFHRNGRERGEDNPAELKVRRRKT